MNVDKKHKLIRQYAVMDAAVHDSQVLENVLLPAEVGRDVWADSAYRSKEIEIRLKAKRLRSKIHYKRARNRALPLNRTLAIEDARVFEPVSNKCLATRSPRWVAN